MALYILSIAGFTRLSYRMLLFSGKWGDKRSTSIFAGK